MCRFADATYGIDDLRLFLSLRGVFLGRQTMQDESVLAAGVLDAEDFEADLYKIPARVGTSHTAVG